MKTTISFMIFLNRNLMNSNLITVMKKKRNLWISARKISISVFHKKVSKLRTLR